MSKVSIRDLCLPAPIQAVLKVGQKEFPSKCSEEYADFMELQEKHNKALVIAHRQLEERLKSPNAAVAKEAEEELNAYLDQEIELKFLPHNLLSLVTGIAPADLKLLRKLIAEPPCKGVK
jgi:hypothetical protein